MSEPYLKTSGRWWQPDGFIDGSCVHDSRVQVFEPGAVDGETRFLPAAVDLHVHGGGGHDVMDGEAAIRGMLTLHSAHGTGAALATSVTAPHADTEHFLEGVARVMAMPGEGEATLLGAHLEGPFINPDKLGAQPPFAVAPDAERLERWFQSGVVRVITFAPELDPDGAVLAACRRHGVRAQIGHTLCNWAEACTALDAGCGITHLYNAMSGFSHREGGTVTAALARAEYAEIITDGLHVDRVAFEAARRAVPGLYSVTDATAATGMPDGQYALGSYTVEKRAGRVLLPDGTLAGSCLTQRASLEVLRGWDLDWHAIGALTSAVPARWLGVTSVGRIGPGALAHWLEIQDDEPVAFWRYGVRHAW